eukprot:PITA_02530
MVRSSCSSKEKLNRGPWSAVEDMILSEYIRIHGDGRWSSVPQKAGLKRCAKSCRLRWVNYVRPNIKRVNISPDEEELICRLHRLLGNRWSLIAGRLPGRTNQQIKSYWNTHLKRKLLIDESQPKTIPKSPSPLQNQVFKPIPVRLTTAVKHSEMETANGCSNPISSAQVVKLSTIEENAIYSMSTIEENASYSIPVDDSERIGFPMANVNLVERRLARNSMSSLGDQQSPHSEDFAEHGATREEYFSDMQETSYPHLNMVSSPSMWTDFGLQEFYMGFPTSLDAAMNELVYEDMYSDRSNTKDTVVDGQRMEDFDTNAIGRIN